MSEAVRLVIWDLDETFWAGTLTEGGMEYRQEVHEIVVELAQRGIMSSICSKNDQQHVNEILSKTGIWDYFIFPSISWEPKGPRIAALIAAVQLRPSTVLLIDDNPMNLNEARHFVPHLQTAAETLIPDLLNDLRFVGRNDPELTRLAHYKVLEVRQADQLAADGNNYDFLRASEIRVSVITDIEPHLHRCVELINRTNQLNFTKLRLQEDREVATKQLQSMLTTFNIQVGLIRVRDKYGDYGHVGFYGYNVLSQSLIHFCFSCRTLHMGVEQWVYQRLGRPRIEIVGDVISDLNEPATIDWISYDDGIGDDDAEAKKRFGSVFIRGGCDLEVIAFYMGLVSTQVVGEYNIIRRGMNIRREHTCFLPLALRGGSPDQIEALRRLGISESDVSSALAEDQEFDLYVFSFVTDMTNAVYKHKTSGAQLPLAGVLWSEDITGLPQELFDLRFRANPALSPLQSVRRDYEYSGMISSDEFTANLELLVSRLPTRSEVVVIEPLETWPDASGKARGLHRRDEMNAIVRRVFSERTPEVRFIRVTDHLGTDEAFDPNHYDRKVYHRLFEAISTWHRPLLEGKRAAE